jgi:hypothetical protein
MLVCGGLRTFGDERLQDLRFLCIFQRSFGIPQH